MFPHNLTCIMYDLSVKGETGLPGLIRQKLMGSIVIMVQVKNKCIYIEKKSIPAYGVKYGVYSSTICYETNTYRSKWSHLLPGIRKVRACFGEAEK